MDTVEGGSSFMGCEDGNHSQSSSCWVYLNAFKNKEKKKKRKLSLAFCHVPALFLSLVH